MDIVTHSVIVVSEAQNQRFVIESCFKSRAVDKCVRTVIDLCKIMLDFEEK